MPQLKGNLVASRPRMIETKRGTVQSYQAAYIPASDEHGFPAVINCTVEAFGQLQGLEAGENVVLTYIETPPYNDRLAVSAVRG